VISRRYTVQLDAFQAIWLEALADLHNCSRAQVLRDALSWYSVRETTRVQRTRYYAVMKLAQRASEWDPISDYLAGCGVSPI
jgi:hypothetical protein